MKNNSNRILLTKAEIEKQFKEQLKFLQKSAADFDKGEYEEAKRMATTIRILLYDKTGSPSLLKSLELEDKTLFFDCALKYDSGALSYMSLVSMRMPECRYYPILDESNSNEKVAFKDYWNQIIFKDENKNEFTRKDIVLFLAHQDGGAHVDPAINEEYYNLSRNNSLGWIGSNGNEKNLIVEGAELAAVRQIAHEVLKTFNVADYHYEDTAKGFSMMGASFFTEPVEMGIPVVRKVGRNEPCPCGAKKADGSSKKFKNCHGY